MIGSLGRQISLRRQNFRGCITEHTEIKDASVLLAQAILVLRRKAEAMPGKWGPLMYYASKLQGLLVGVERAERDAAGEHK